MKIDTETVIKLYTNGKSLNAIAQELNSYPTSIKRVLERNNVELRHDVCVKGVSTVKDGDKLINWAKTQGRLVTKQELASVIGVRRLSPSYFVKYPELGKYIAPREQSELLKYTNELYKWLQDNGIKYKPNDKTAIQSSVTALLLEDYANIILQIAIKPKSMSRNRHTYNMYTKSKRAIENKVEIIFLEEKGEINIKTQTMCSGVYDYE